MTQGPLHDRNTSASAHDAALDIEPWPWETALIGCTMEVVLHPPVRPLAMPLGRLGAQRAVLCLAVLGGHAQTGV